MRENRGFNLHNREREFGGEMVRFPDRVKKFWENYKSSHLDQKQGSFLDPKDLDQALKEAFAEEELDIARDYLSDLMDSEREQWDLRK